MHKTAVNPPLCLPFQIAIFSFIVNLFINFRIMATSLAVADLGKRLLEASRKGNAEEVRQLMATGAPITTDWVCILFEIQYRDP